MLTIIDDAEAHFEHEQNLVSQQQNAYAERHEKHHAQTLGEMRKIVGGFNKYTSEYEWIAGGLRVKQLLVEQLLVEHLLTEGEEYRRQDQESGCENAGC